MKKYYIIYKENTTDNFCKYDTQEAEIASKAIIQFEEKFPNATFMVMYDITVNDIATCRKDS